MSEKTLRQQTVSGMVWSSVQRFGAMGISFTANIVFARLLSPQDFGSIGILMVLIAISNIFVDAGFGAALIQKKNPTNNDYSTIFYLNLLISVALYVVLYFCAPGISRFYNIPALCDLLRVLGIILFFNSFSVIQDNQLRKQLNFKKLSVVSITSAIIGAVFGITSAYLGFGVWSLVINSLVGGFLRGLLLWILSKWRPLWVFNLQSLKELFSFGGFLLANSILVTLRLNLLALVIGKLFSSRDLGFYAQAKRLVELPTTSFSTIVGQVSFPIFSTIQSNIAQLKNAQQKSIKSLAFVSFPLIILMMVIANSLIILLYTDKWAESVLYFQILCIGSLAVCLQEVNANLINAIGKSRLFFKWSVVKTITLFVLIFLGSYYGIKGLLYGFVLQNFLTYLIDARLAAKFTGYKIFDQMKDLFPIFFLSIFSGLATWLFGKYLNINYIIVMISQILFYISIYFYLSYLVKIDVFISFSTIAKYHLRRINKT
jgi:O-antigen/teichoic acid export membrane protein